MATIALKELIGHYLGISRLLAGQLDFRSAIHAVAAEIRHIIEHDHLDVCILIMGDQYHTAYETGMSTAWGAAEAAPVAFSPIRSLLYGEVDFILSENACADPRFDFDGAFNRPIIEQGLKSRIHVPMKVQGSIIGALSCSSQRIGFYNKSDIVHAKAIADLLSPYFFALRAADRAQHSAIIEAEARAREEGLRQGALKLTSALEEERQRIGMDLHDQTLADLTRLSRRVELHLHEGRDHQATLEFVANGLQQAMHDLRQIIERVKPTVLELFGFAQATENHLERSIHASAADITGTLIDASHGRFDTIDAALSVAFFRIGQEAITNAVRHAKASHITVKLLAESDALMLVIDDDGCGFSGTGNRLGGGIDNMATRARLVSASLTFGPGDMGRGTSVSVRLPLVER